MQGLWWWYPCVLVSVTWHLTRDMRHRDIAGVVSAPQSCSSCFISPWRHAPPIVFPTSSHSVSITSRMTRRICFSKYRGICCFLLYVKTNGPSWHVTQVKPPWPLSHGTRETWRASSDEMSQWRRAGVIYRGLESAKLSRTWGLPLGPPRDTQTQSNSQKHEH